MDISAMLNTTCTIQTLTVSQDSIGGVVEAYVERLENVPCRIRALNGDEVASLGTDRSNSTHRVYLQPGENLESLSDLDRIVSEKGRVLDVVFVNNVDEQDDLIHVDCVERKNG
jgi:head-tail adaptor